MTGDAALGPSVATASAPPRSSARAAVDVRPDASAPEPTAPLRPASRPHGPDARRDDEAADAATAAPFADFLVSPPPTPPASAPATDVDRTAATAPPDPAAPGQLLALLDGFRLGAAVPDPGAGAAGAAGAPPLTAELATAPASGSAASAPETDPSRQAAAGASPASSAAPEADGPAMAGSVPLAAAAARPEVDTAVLEPLPAPAPATTGAPGVAALAAPPPPAARTPQADPAPPPLSLPAQPADGFDDGFGSRIAWIAGQRLGQAEIRLNPEHLGVIDVRLQLDGDQVRAEFNSANPEVRQAIEASLPRLRDLLGEHGLQLGQADVGQRQPGGDDAAARSPGQAPGGRPGSGRDAATPPEVTAPAPPRSRGLVDEYA